MGIDERAHRCGPLAGLGGTLTHPRQRAFQGFVVRLHAAAQGLAVGCFILRRIVQMGFANHQGRNAGGGHAAGAGGQPAWTGIIPFILMGLIFWFLIIGPQMKRQKEHQQRIGGLKKGDQVATQGGLVGKVVKVDDTYAELEIAPNVRVKAVKSTIADLIEPGTKPAND